jgi:hypothetical protein
MTSQVIARGLTLPNVFLLSVLGALLSGGCASNPSDSSSNPEPPPLTLSLKSSQGPRHTAEASRKHTGESIFCIPLSSLCQ